MYCRSPQFLSVATVAALITCWCFVIAASTLSSTVFAASETSCTLALSNASLTEKIPGSVTRAVYLSIANPCLEEIKVVAVSATGFGHAHLHKTHSHGDVSKMKKVDEIVLSPGETVEMRQGALHIMLMKPEDEVTDNRPVEIELIMDDGSKASILVNGPA